MKVTQETLMVVAAGSSRTQLEKQIIPDLAKAGLTLTQEQKDILLRFGIASMTSGAACIMKMKADGHDVSEFMKGDIYQGAARRVEEERSRIE